jgi:gliding motility-associated lipoprotein GldH
MRDKVCLFLFVMILFGCNHVYKEYDKKSFSTYTWEFGQTVVFSPEIKEVGKPHKLIVGLRHLYGLQVKEIPIALEWVSPSGKITTKAYGLQILDETNKHLGRCAGDICDLEIQIDTIAFDEAGVYRYTVSHTIQNARIPGIMELGLIIDLED